MRRATRGFGVFIVMIVLALAADYARVRAKDGRVSHAISRCNGRMGSIPMWPLGTEYRVTFFHALRSEQLDQIAELNSLRGSVHVTFVDCQFSGHEARQTMLKLHRCRLYRLVDGEMSILDDSL